MLTQTKIQGKFYPLKNQLGGLTEVSTTAGRIDLEKIPDIEIACLAFDVNVTAEEVK